MQSPGGPDGGDDGDGAPVGDGGGGGGGGSIGTGGGADAAVGGEKMRDRKEITQNVSTKGNKANVKYDLLALLWKSWTNSVWKSRYGIGFNRREFSPAFYA